METTLDNLIAQNEEIRGKMDEIFLLKGLMIYQFESLTEEEIKLWYELKEKGDLITKKIVETILNKATTQKPKQDVYKT